MPVCRLIFRLDFGINFDIIEHPGKIMQTLWDAFHEETHEGVELRENRNNRTILARFVSKDGNSMRHFNVEPTSLNATYEAIDGIEIDHILTTLNGFHVLVNLAGQICNDFHINDILRSGLRFFYFNKIGKVENDVMNLYSKILSTNILNSLVPQLGNLEDYGISLDGSFDDGLKYHFRTGPYHRQEAEKYFSVIIDNFYKLTNFDMICDIDLYENNFSLSNRQLSHIYRPIIMKGKTLVETLENELVSLLEVDECLHKPRV